MLSTVLKSKRAVAVNIEIMRAFVRLRQFLASHRIVVETSTYGKVFPGLIRHEYPIPLSLIKT